MGEEEVDLEEEVVVVPFVEGVLQGVAEVLLEVVVVVASGVEVDFKAIISCNPF